MPQRNRTTYVEPKNVHSQLGFRAWGRMEKVARIETVLPVEFPSGSMKAAGARLEHHGHGSSGRKAVLCAVIRRQGAEFGDGIAGGRDAHVARTAAVKILTTVQQVNVVGRPQTIETHVGVAANRNVEETGDVAGGTSRQPRKHINAATVGRDL